VQRAERRAERQEVRTQMTPRAIPIVAALTSLVFGGVGLVLPGTLAAAFGVELDPLSTALARLACAAYVGYDVLAWLARDLRDPEARRAVAATNAISWGLGAVVAAATVSTGIGDGRIWIMVVMQVGFAFAWTEPYRRANR
jgi:hypothetical protein